MLICISNTYYYAVSLVELTAYMYKKHKVLNRHAGFWFGLQASSRRAQGERVSVDGALPLDLRASRSGQSNGLWPWSDATGARARTMRLKPFISFRYSGTQTALR